MQDRSNFTQLILLASVAATGMGQTLVFAILPSLGRAAGMADISVGLIISCSALMFALASPVWGQLSEHLGRKPVLIIGLSGYTLGTIIFASVFWWGINGVLTGAMLLTLLIVSRVLQAAIMAATPPAAAAYMADITSVAGRTKGMGRIGAAHNLGTVVGPALGGLLAAISLVAPLYIAAGVTAVMALWVALALRESPWIQQRGPLHQRFSTAGALRASFTAYADRRLWDVLLIGVAMFMAFAMVQQTLGFMYQDRLAMSPSAAAGGVGIAMMFAAIASLISQAVIVQRLGWPPEALLKLGIPVMASGIALLLWAPDQLSVTFSVVLLGLGLGLGMPGVSSAASLRVGAHEQGAVAGLMSACPALGFILGPVIGTGLYQINPLLPYSMVFVLLLPLMVAVGRMGSGVSDVRR